MMKKSVYLALVGGVAAESLSREMDFDSTLPCHFCIRAGYNYVFERDGVDGEPQRS